MSDFFPHFDDFSIDSSRTSKRLVNKKLPKITINVDNSNENADWIKRVRKENVDSSHKDLNKKEGV